MKEKTPNEMHAAGELKVVLKAFRRTLGQEMHVLQEHPSLTWQQMHNRLQWIDESQSRRAVYLSLAPELEERTRDQSNGWLHMLNRPRDSGAITRTLTGRRKPITGVFFSPNGDRLATCSQSDAIKIFDPSTYEELATFRGLVPTPTSAVFSPDGTRLACVREDKYMTTGMIVDTDSGETLLTLSGHRGPVNSIVFSPDGTRLTSISADRTIKIWDATTGEEATSLKARDSLVGKAVFSPDGTRLASCSTESYSPDGKRGTDGAVKVFDVPSGEERLSLTVRFTHKDMRGRVEIHDLQFSPDGTRLASCQNDGTVRIWNPKTGKEQAVCTGHVGAVMCIAFSSDGKHLASGSSDRTVRIWDPGTGKELATFSGHGGTIKSVAFSPDGTRLVSGSEDTAVKIWDLSSGVKSVAPTQEEIPSRQNVFFSPDGTRLASVSNSTSGGGEIWNLVTGERLTSVPNLNGQSAVFSPNGARLASLSWDNTIQIWDATTGKQLASLDEHFGIESFSFSPDGSRLASCAKGTVKSLGTVRIWSAASGKGLFTFDNPGGDWQGLAMVVFSPDGARLASISDRMGGETRNLVTGERLATIRSLNKSAVFSPDGTRVASISSGGMATVMDAATGDELATFGKSTDGTYSLALFPDGVRLLSRSEDGTIRIRNLRTGEDLVSLDLRMGTHERFILSPDGAFLAFPTFSFDLGNPVRIWNTATGEELPALRGYRGASRDDLFFSPDGTRAAFTASDKVVEIWEMESGVRSATHAGSAGGGACAFSPDGSILAYGDSSGAMYLLRIMGTTRRIPAPR